MPLSYLEQALDPLAGRHDGGGEDAREAAGEAELRGAQLVVGRLELHLLADAEAHEAQREDGRHAH